MKKFSLLLCLLVFLLVVNTAVISAEDKTTLTVSAAASLTDAMADIQKLYLKSSPNTELKFNFGASGTLQQQIENGAPVDVFISAGKKQMDALDTKNLIAKTSRVNLLGNKIVMIIRKGLSSIKAYKDITSSKITKLALGETKTVPVGQYAVESLTKMGYLSKINAKIVYAKDVKEVLTWVETGNADAGIVYKTDAITSKNIKIIAYPPSNSYTPVTYPAAAIEGSKNAAASKDFINFLKTKEAKAVFVKYGFSIPAK